MPWAILLLGQLCLMTTISAINRPVYKIVLTQKGYAQFIQYDVETPPLREFTFCTWIRVYDFSNDQTIFTYVANGNNRIMRLWLDTGGRSFKLSVKDAITTSFPVDLVKDVWRHICLSYQSDYGAWALYVDSRLAACETAQSLFGYILPGGGSVLIGYGTNDNGGSNGLEGEVFGANMILTSTIEKNFTNKKNPEFEQKPFKKNKVRESGKNLKYVILSDLQTDEIQNNFEKSLTSSNATSSNFIQFRTPQSYLEHDIGLDIISTTKADSIDKEILDITLSETLNPTKSRYFDIWNKITPTGTVKAYSTKTTSNSEQPSFSTRILPTISTYETPPAPPSTYFDIPDETPKTQSIHNLKDSPSTKVKNVPTKVSDEISEIETPPPVDGNNKVYGQWTSSKFAGTVLNYLKSINFRGKQPRKIPATIPLTKYSDAYPYVSELTINKVRPSQFKRRNLIEKRYDIMKRDPQINVQILEDDLRSNIIKMHAQTQPKIVEINSRGEGKNHAEHRFYRSANYDVAEKVESFDEMYRQPRPFTLASNKKNKIRDFSSPNIPNQKYKSVLPFLKSLEYTVESQKMDLTATTNNDMYSKSLKGNKWHNIKSYNNDYTPRKINMEPEDTKNESLKRHPTIRLKYKPEDRKLVEDQDPTILKGRKLAMEVSNQSDANKDTVSIFKYNHGYITNQEKPTDKTEKTDRKNTKRTMNSKNFNKQIKIGNALNEHFFLGNNDYKKKQSFIGGNDNVPDINRYRSDIDNEKGKVPSSLGPRVCKNVELYDRVLYVQQDESIDMTHILSPVRAKNIAIEFIIQNYKKCSLTDSNLEINPKLFIDWSKTPVRLFGGAYPRTTTDLCGFF